jgi:hypothetical protein
MRFWVFWVFLFVVGFQAWAWAKAPKPAGGKKMANEKEEVLSIERGTVARFGRSSVAVGFVGKDEKGTIAFLEVVKPGAKESESVDARVGTSVDLGSDGVIEVMDIKWTQDGENESVTIKRRFTAK